MAIEDDESTPERAKRPAKRGRGRPRDPTLDRAIREATLVLLRDRGYGGLTMSDVAERAGVAKTTMYRRWPTKAEMVLDALAGTLEQTTVKLDATRDPLETLRELIIEFYRDMAGHRTRPVVPAELLREADVAVAFNERFLRPLHDKARALVARAIDGGRVRPDADPAEVVDALVALAIYHPLMYGAPADPDYAARHFELVMRGVETR